MGMVNKFRFKLNAYNDFNAIMMRLYKNQSNFFKVVVNFT